MMASVAKELFTRRFWMDVEERAFYSDDWIREVGIMGVHTMEEAENLLSQYRRVRITIPEIADYLTQDYKIHLIDHGDASHMFSLVNTHLSNWLDVVNNLAYVSTIPPIEDFEALDLVAEKLFPYRKADTAMAGILELFKGSIGTSTAMDLKNGIYKPYAPLLFKYCQLVWG